MPKYNDFDLDLQNTENPAGSTMLISNFNCHDTLRIPCNTGCGHHCDPDLSENIARCNY